jgi:hypothetical protein
MCECACVVAVVVVVVVLQFTVSGLTVRRRYTSPQKDLRREATLKRPKKVPKPSGFSFFNLHSMRVFRDGCLSVCLPSFPPFPRAGSIRTRLPANLCIRQQLRPGCDVDCEHGFVPARVVSKNIGHVYSVVETISNTKDERRPDRTVKRRTVLPPTLDQNPSHTDPYGIRVTNLTYVTSLVGSHHAWLTSGPFQSFPSFLLWEGQESFRATPVA